MAREIDDLDQQELDAVKGWWKKHGMTLLSALLFIVAIILGWQAWQRHEANQAATASQTYDQLVEMTSNFTTLPEGQRTQVAQLADRLVDNASGTLYADFGRLIQARVAVDANDLGTAAASLGQVVKNGHDDYVKDVARINLARVQIDRDHADGALDLLKPEMPVDLQAQQLSVRGDAYVAQKKLDDARTSYQQALKIAHDHQLSDYGIKLKLDDIAPQEAS